MDSTILQTILNEVLHELQTLKGTNEALSSKIDNLEQRTGAFEQRLEQVNLVSPPVDTTSINQLVSEKLTHIANIVEAQPKAVVRRLHLQFFPDGEAHQFYRYITGRILPWLVVFFIVYCGFCLARQSFNQSTDLQTQKLFYQQYQTAWSRLDSIAPPSLRRTMDDIWLSSRPTHPLSLP